jgi:tetratricopeptide (TPR) repeat protein
MGTLQRAGDQLRATAQLVEAPAGTLLSSQTLQAPLGDVFRLQDELARRIVESLSPSLSEREGPLRRGVPASARAYEFYLRANEVVRDASQVAIARDLYRQCVDEDPSFAPGWAKLGRCHRILAKYFLERPEENLARADEAYRRALDLDPDLPVAHKLYAHREAEMGRARDAMVRLLGLARTNRNDPEIFAGLVHACRYSGLVEASLAAHREARRLDPHLPTSAILTWWATGDLELVLRDPAEAFDFEVRAMALHALGRSAEALELLREVETRPLPTVLLLVARALFALFSGRPEAVTLLHDALAVHDDPEALFLYGSCQAQLGDDDGAVASLRRAVEGGYHFPQALVSGVWLAGLRRKGRLDALLERAEAGRREAQAAFRDAGGESLLGAL